MKKNTKVFSKVYRTVLHHFLKLESVTSLYNICPKNNNLKTYCREDKRLYLFSHNVHGSMKGLMGFIKEEKHFIFSLANYFKSKENYLMVLLCVETLNF